MHQIWKSYWWGGILYKANYDLRNSHTVTDLALPVNRDANFLKKALSTDYSGAAKLWNNLPRDAKEGKRNQFTLSKTL